MRKIKFLFLRMLLLILRGVYFFIKIFPTEKKITFISRQGNSPSLDFRLLEEALKKKYPDYKIVLLTKKLDNKFIYTFHMFVQMYHIATSKIVLLDSYCIVISVLKHKKSLKVIQLWHAIGSMKKFGYAMLDKEEGSSSEIAQIMCMHKNYDCALISSYSFIKDYEEGFGITKDKVVEIPLPRVDLLLDKEYRKKKRKELLDKNPKLKEKKNILYCCTFRKKPQVGSKNIDDLVKEIDFNKYNLLYKPHPLCTVTSDDSRIIKDFDSTFDALYVADYVICDYSSMIYEVGLMELPLYLYAYDWDEYCEKRELNLDLTKLPVLFTKDAKKIIKAIEKNKFNYKEFKKFVDYNVTVPKNGCTNAILELIDSYLHDINKDDIIGVE